MTRQFLFYDTDSPDTGIIIQRGSLGLLIDAGAVLCGQIERDGGPETEKEKLLIETVEQLTALYEEHFGTVETIR